MSSSPASSSLDNSNAKANNPTNNQLHAAELFEEEHIQTTSTSPKQQQKQQQPPPLRPRILLPSRSFWHQLYDRWQAAWRHSSFSIKAIHAYPSNLSIAEGWGDGLPCSHSHREKDCIVYVFKGLFRGWAVGYLLKSCFTLALSITSRQMFRR